MKTISMLPILIAAVLVSCPTCAEDGAGDAKAAPAIERQGLMVRINGSAVDCGGDALCRRRAERAGLVAVKPHQALTALLMAVEQTCAGGSCAMAGRH